MAPFSYLSIYLAAISLAVPTTDCSPPVASSPRALSLSSTRIDLVQRSSKGFLHLDRRDGVAAAGISIDAGFWFGDFTVGDSTNLSMLIDTGSGDVVVNPTYYKPSKTSQSLNTTFSNSYGTTSSNGTGSGILNGTLFTDQMSFQGLAAKQTVGSATGDSPLPHQGIVGFSGQFAAQFPTNSTSFFQSLCTQQQVTQCRFGLALTSNGTGTQILGELDSSLYSGNLTVVPILEEWAVFGDLAINGTVVARDLVVELDSGTATIVGPIDAVTSIFNATGIQSVITSTADGDLLTGYFPCDKPPTVGLSLPSQTNVSAAVTDDSTSVSHIPLTFNIPLDAWAAVDNGNNNCTAILSGQNYAKYPGLWVFGQPFFQGLYVDHNFENGTVGFAHQNPASSANTTTIAPESPTTTSSINSAAGMSCNIVFIAITGLTLWCVLLG